MSWIAVAVGGAAVVGAASGAMQASAQEDAQQAQGQNNVDVANLSTQRAVWLAQQQRQWDLQDKASARAQKSADIGVFQKFHADPSDYTPSANLAQAEADKAQSPSWDPTQLGTLSQFLKPGDASNGNAAPAPVASSSGTVPGRGDNIIWQPSKSDVRGSRTA